MDVKDRVRRFIVENYYIPDPDRIRDDTSLLMDGVVDSTGVLELVTFLENEFEIKVDDTELLPENLDSLEQVARFVAQKRAT